MKKIHHAHGFTNAGTQIYWISSFSVDQKWTEKLWPKQEMDSVNKKWNQKQKVRIIYEQNYLSMFTTTVIRQEPEYFSVASTTTAPMCVGNTHLGRNMVVIYKQREEEPMQTTVNYLFSIRTFIFEQR